MKNYAMIEHFELVENGNIEGIKCDYFKGSQGNILIPKTQVNKYLKIKNDEGYYVTYEDNYYDEITPHSVEAYCKNSKYDSPVPYIDPEGLRKIIEITRKDPEIISGLDL